MKIIYFYAVMIITAVISTSLIACAGSKAKEAFEYQQEPDLKQQMTFNERTSDEVSNTKESAQNDRITITIVYDNEPWDKRLENAWGFACVIELPGTTILFDTGEKGEVLLRNMENLEINPDEIDAIFISHSHYDHVGGLKSLLENNNDITVYVLSSFPEEIIRKITLMGARLEEVKEAREIYPDIYTTGELSGEIKEQSLLIKTARGLIVVTGCAHPGIVEILKKAKEIEDDNIYLVIGGFHMKDFSRPSIEQVIKDLEELEVKMVAPSHCTGELALQCFNDKFGERYIKSGLGRKITIEIIGTQ